MTDKTTADRQRAIEREADDAAGHYADVRDACPYPFSSWEGRIFIARFAVAQQQRSAAP